MYFTESESKPLIDKHLKVSNFYGVSNVYESKITESALSTPNSEINKVFKPKTEN